LVCQIGSTAAGDAMKKTTVVAAAIAFGVGGLIAAASVLFL
jgi:hypothetical protein